QMTAVARLYFQQTCMVVLLLGVETKSRIATVIDNALSRSRPNKPTACSTLLTVLRKPMSAELASRKTSAEKATSVRRTRSTCLSGTCSCAVSRSIVTATGRNGGKFLRAQGWASRGRSQVMLAEQSSTQDGTFSNHTG